MPLACQKGRRLPAPALFLASLVTLSCAQPLKESGTGGILAAETFLADIAQNVAGSVVKIETLVPVGTGPHEFQPRPADLARIRSARLLIVSGRGYEAWLEPALGALGDTKIVVASSGLSGELDRARGLAPEDPHLWMDPRNVISYVEVLRGVLTELYPEHEADFAAGARAYQTSLTELDASIRRRLSAIPVERRLLLTNHEALGRFAAAYDPRIVGTVLPGTSSEASPAARSLAGLVDTIRASGAKVIFLDLGENAELAKEIARESGARVVTDLYVEGLSGPEGPAPSYLEMLKHDAEVIAHALE